MIGWLLLALPALAERPDEGGLYAFDGEDTLATHDGPLGRVRVTYSASGPNEVREGDDDGDGVPDFVVAVAESAEDVLAVYEATGFRAPVAESEMGLDGLGGSDAFDVYLVDFAGVADGWFSTDACRGAICSGYMVMENDFRGYGYPSIDEAIRVLTSHELFHAVQAAYNANQPDWMREGTAVWAELLYDPDNDDFFYFCNAYLDDVGRSLDRPPAGAGSSFSYGTALFWAFLVEQYGVPSAVALQEAMEDRDEEEALDAVEDVIVANGDALDQAWATFTRWNLATGDRAGAMDSYSFAAGLRGIEAELEGSAIVDGDRFYPLAATYYRLDHAGGALFFAASDDPSGLVFSLHPVSGGEDDGPVEEAVHTWAPEGLGSVELGELEPGGYWLVVTYPERAESSTSVDFCLGGEADVAACRVGETGDSGGGETGAPDTAEAETGEGKPGGCGCATGSRDAAGIAALAVLAALSRRRRLTGAADRT